MFKYSTVIIFKPFKLVGLVMLSIDLPLAIFKARLDAVEPKDMMTAEFPSSVPSSTYQSPGKRGRYC